MNKFLRSAAIVTIVIVLVACGGVHNIVVTQPNEKPVVKQATLLPIEVSSKEQTPAALRLNAQWQQIATDELQSMLIAKSITTAADSQTNIGCRIELVYGNRALRYFAGLGAGAGHIRTTIELKDNNGGVLYATNSEADLAVGLFGGDMQQVARKTIKKAVEEFGSRL